MPRTYLFADNRTVHRGGEKSILYTDVFCVSERSLNNRPDVRKGLDGKLKKELRGIEDRRKVEFTRKQSDGNELYLNV